jgi:hypothetical protein
MNANSAGPSGLHLDLAELIAEANGGPVDAAAREHLTGCDQCLLEASRWILVADGVRSLATAVPETTGPGPAWSDAAAPEGATPEGATREAATREAATREAATRDAATRDAATREAATPEAATPETATPGTVTSRAAAAPLDPRRRRGPARPARSGRRTRLAGTAAAGLVLVGGAVYGVAASNLVHVSRNHPGSGSDVALTAVTGCSALMQADGTLTQASGGQLVITTANGQRVTVTTTASTFVGETGALRSDITDGASVTVGGVRSTGVVDALLVTIGNPSDDHPQLPSGDTVVKGTVTGATAVGFTVVTAGGTRVPVATSAETVVNIVNPGLGRLPVGGTIYALGRVGPGGTLAARAVAVVAQLPAGGPQIHAHLSVKDCSPASVNGAVLALADGA